MQLFRLGLADGGYREGPDLELAPLSPDEGYEGLAGIAESLVARRPALIAAFGLPAALAAKAATSTIPIVMMIGADPVEFGLVASLARPGGNITGITQFYGELGGKRLDLLLDLLPSNALVAVLINRSNPNSASHLRNIEEVARVRDRRLQVAHAASEPEIDAVFAAFAAQRAGGVLVVDDPFYGSQGEHMIALAARYALPTMFYRRRDVEDGGLMSYAVEGSFVYREGGRYAARVLAGADPASLPILQPTSFELVINLRTARALGLTIPPTLLSRADEVIE
jgi:putative ABC transport system substrate-binding protein